MRRRHKSSREPVRAFNGIVLTPLVSKGEDFVIPRSRGGHNFATVYTEMMLQILRDYSGLPDVRTLTVTQIRFFYDGLRPELKRAYTNGN